jgi:hypothetical protein
MWKYWYPKTDLFVGALVGILIFVTMGKLLEQSEGSNQLIWGLGGGGLVACYLVYKLAGEKE